MFSKQEFGNRKCEVFVSIILFLVADSTCSRGSVQQMAQERVGWVLLVG